MKRTILTVIAASALTGGMWLRAQQSEEGSAATAPEENKTAAMEQCMHMCAQYKAESPGSLLAWTKQLNLTEDQTASLRTVEEKAITDAKALLTPEQLDKLKELAQNTKPESMMCMKGMMPGMKGKGHGMKGKPSHGEAHH